MQKDASSFLRKCEEYEELSPQISREDLHMITMLKGELDLFIKGVDFEGLVNQLYLLFCPHHFFIMLGDITENM